MISVVIPLYNKGPHIGKAIESVLLQTVKPIDIIVVDDGSTDEGGAVVEKYVDQGVRHITQINQGVSAARNFGVRVAKGEYVAFLDADDWWLPSHIETLSYLVMNFPKASLYSTAHIIERGGRQYKPKSTCSEGWSGYVDDFFSNFSVGLSLVNSITACVNRTDFIAVGGFPVGVSRGEDIVCWAKLALMGKVAHAEVATAVYFQDAVNRTDKLREVEPPSSLKYFSNLLRSNNLSWVEQKGIKRLFERMAFFTAAGFRMQGDRVGVAAIRKLAFSSGLYLVGVVIGLLSFIPSSFLYWARSLRHPRVAPSNLKGN